MSERTAARVLAAAMIGAALGCAACSGSGTSSSTQVPPTSPATVVEASPFPSPTLSPDQLAAATAGVTTKTELMDYRDPAGRYTVKEPRGWQLEENPDYVVASIPGQADLTTFGIFCLPGGRAADLMTADHTVAINAGTNTVLSSRTDQVAGVPAQRVESVTSLSDLQLRNITYYFEGRGCAWRIQMTTSSQQDVTPLVSTLVASFAFVGG